MRTCIYLKKQEPEVTFESAEHIIPAGIGGIMTLDYGVVSDQANSKFSAIELDFMRNSIIALPRQFFGPGKRGATSEEKASKSNIHVIYMDDNKSEPNLGYIKMGKPHQIPQMILKSKNELQMSFDAADGDYKEQLDDFLNALKSYNGKYVQVGGKELADVDLIIGYSDKKWFVVSKLDNLDEKLNELVASIVAKGIQLTSSPSVKSSQVNSVQSLSFNIEYFYRVCAKIAFNYLVKVNGTDFVLQDIFDPIRNWIVNGGQNEFAKLEDSKSFEFLKEVKFPSDSHKIFIIQVGTNLIAVVAFYGKDFNVTVRLCNNFKGRYDLDGFICDWRNRIEYNLPDYLHTISGDQNIT